MQVDAIKITDYIRTNDEQNQGVKMSGCEAGEQKNVHGELKTIKVDSANYNKSGKKNDDGMDFKNEIDRAAELGEATMNQVNNLSKAVDEDVVAKVEDDGFDIMDTEANTIVTVADQIKLVLAKAGVDVSKMGGLDADVVEKMTGSVVQAMELSAGIDEELSDATIKYLVENDLDPTIKNMYNASYCAPQGEDGEVKEVMTDDELVELLTSLGDKLDALIEEAEAGDKALCEKMLKQDIPLTKDNLEYMAKLQSFEMPTEDEILQAIDDASKEGKEPEDAYLIKGYSLMDQAREAVDEIQSMNPSALSDITSRRQLVEIQLSMTVEATFTMMKNGVEVNTTDLADLLDKLKLQENSLLNMLLKQEGKNASQSAIDTYKETMLKMTDIQATPAEMFGRFTNVSQSTITEIHTVSVSFSAEFTAMESTYEAVGTEVRADLGDSIKKAFSNVDDILDDLGLDTSESNEQAVRALAYNKMNITAESVTEVKGSIELVNRTFKSMTPSVVAEMIKRGENPLDMKLEDLLKRTAEIKTELGTDKDEQSFAKFLWKAEHTEGITEEERMSYIGVYRLLDKVDKSDGAAIGALISQGTELTMRNLMTAVRSSKHSGREYEVSDKVGALDQLNVKDLSITEQIEKVFMTDRCRDAKEAMSPDKMSLFAEDDLMEMNPDEFATAMETTDGEALEAAYQKNLADQLKAAIDADKKVYEIIEEFKLPTTGNMISAIEQMLSDNNKAVRDLAKRMEKDELGDVEYLITELTERFGEACKTPEEMAEAQEALGDLAERVMKAVNEADNVKTIDLGEMKLIVNQTRAYQEMAEKEETYHIPIMVADEAGNMNLRIVRGTNESGLVKMVMSMTQTGTISSTFKYVDGQVEANIECDTLEMREALSMDAPYIAQMMQEETGFGFSFSFSRSIGLTASDIFNMENGTMEVTKDKSNEIQTEALYGIARGFLRVVGEMFS